MTSKWSSASRKALAISRTAAPIGSGIDDDETPDLEIALNLDGNLLKFEDSKWVLENSLEVEWKERYEKLQEQLDRVEEDHKLLQEKCKRINEESNLVKFKNQILVEMLAITTLDEERHREEVTREKVRSEAMKKELRSLLSKAIAAGVELNSEDPSLTGSLKNINQRTHSDTQHAHIHQSDVTQVAIPSRKVSEIEQSSPVHSNNYTLE